MLTTMPMGDAGTKYTLKMMSAIARGASRSATIQQTAHELVSGIPATATAQIAAIRRYVGSFVTFQDDPPGIEYVQQPVRLVQEIAAHGVTFGDCDDVATLAAALGLAIGLKAQYVVTAFKPLPTPFAHVYLQLSGDGQLWETLDTTRPRGLQPTVTRIATYTI